MRCVFTHMRIMCAAMTTKVPFIDFGIFSRAGGCYLLTCATFAPCVVVGNIAEAHFEPEERRTDVCYLTACFGSGALWLTPLLGFATGVPPAMLTPVMLVPCLATGLLNHKVQIDAHSTDIPRCWVTTLLGILYPCTICQARTTQHLNGSDRIVYDPTPGQNPFGRKARLIAPAQMRM